MNSRHAKLADGFLLRLWKLVSDLSGLLRLVFDLNHLMLPPLFPIPMTWARQMKACGTHVLSSVTHLI